MPTTLDCYILRHIFGSDRMRAVFDTQNLLQSWLNFWAALAEAQADAGMIPVDAAAKIRSAAKAENFDLVAIGEGVREGRHSLMPSIRALTAAAGDAGRYVHWGTTTQDVTDTGTVLQSLQALDILQAGVAELIDILSKFARQHKSHPMAGRTHWQHAVPITLGLKLALWVEALKRDAERLARSREKISSVEIWGGGGTLASMGKHAAAVQEHLSRRLNLRKSDVPWYNLRDQFGEMISNLGLLAATIERICLEVGRLSATEIGEMSEPQTKTQVGSSTMPQKRNPINGERAAATCKLVRGLVPVMQECMIVAHERDMANTAVEWLLVPQAFILIDGAMQLAHHILVDLQLDTERMTQNLDMTRGGIVAEAVMMGLAEQMGKARAHELSLELTKEAVAKRVDLLDVLMANPEVKAALSPEEMRKLVQPENYVGMADQVVDNILDGTKA